MDTRLADDNQRAERAERGGSADLFAEGALSPDNCKIRDVTKVKRD